MASSSQEGDREDISLAVNSIVRVDKSFDEGVSVENPNPENVGEDDDAVVWDDDGEEEEDKKVASCLIGKLWTNCNINAKAFISTIKNVWGPKHGLDINGNEDGMLGHGTKDCDELVGEGPLSLKYRSWMKASPWKPSISSAKVEDGTSRSCAKKLFITKPLQKESRTVSEQLKEAMGKLGNVSIAEKGCESPANAHTPQTDVFISSGSQVEISSKLAAVGEEFSCDGTVEGDVNGENKQGEGFVVGKSSGGSDNGKKWKKVERKGVSFNLRKMEVTCGGKRERVEASEMEIDYHPLKRVDIDVASAIKLGWLLLQ